MELGWGDVGPLLLLVFVLPLIWSRGAHSSRFLRAVQYVAMEVINPAMIDCTLDQIGGNERVKKDLVRC